MREIIVVAQNDPTAKQLESAATLRLEMFEGKRLLDHTRTVLLNIRRKLTDALPEPSAVADDKESVTLQALLRIADESCTIAAEKAEAEKRDGISAKDSSREFCIGAFSSIVQIADAAGPDPTSHTLLTVRSIADAALSAFTSERTEEYITLVAQELISATEEGRETSPSEDEIRTIAEQMLRTVKNGGRMDEERFVSSFREALRRIAHESRFGTEHAVSECDRIRTIIEKTVSGALAFLEIRTVGVAKTYDIPFLEPYGQFAFRLRRWEFQRLHRR